MASQARLGEHVPFDERNVVAAPASPGVYVLYRRHRLIYIGLAAEGSTIRERLQHHLRGAGGPCTRCATGFDYEAAGDPGALYRLYLRVYRKQTGGLLPDCNRNSELGALSAA